MATAAVTITGTPANPVLNFTVPQGEKGDPGGLTVTAFNGDLDTVLTPGGYGVDQASLHLPIAQAGFLIVGWSANTVTNVQTFITNLGAIYVRRRYNSVWSAWRSYNSTRVDQTAGRAIYQWDDLNNREQLVYGDTGRRTVTANLINGWTATTVTIRRTGAMVNLIVTGLDRTNATAEQFMANMSGFSPEGSGLQAWISWPEEPINVFLRIQGGFIAKANFSATGSKTVAYSSFTWMTDSAWPTTLPGTASGTIPNL